MTLRLVSKKDAAAVRAAKKVLKRLAKTAKTLGDAEEKAAEGRRKDYPAAGAKYERLLDELDSLGVAVYGNEAALEVEMFA